MGRKSKVAEPRSTRGNPLWSTPPVKSNDDQSIGSALSLKDQFDILVPIRIPDRVKSSDESDVSSITLDEHQKMLKYIYSMRNQRQAISASGSIPVGFCCCSEMVMKENTNNFFRKKKVAGYEMAPHSIDKTCDISRSQFSLFDALSDEEDADEDRLLSTETDDQTQIKRKLSWRKSIRRKMPWSKK